MEPLNCGLQEHGQESITCIEHFSILSLIVQVISLTTYQSLNLSYVRELLTQRTN
jgi:hypothetical protein